MYRLRASVIKEILLLIRDRAGLALMFLMPVVLIFVMTMIQDTTFRKLDETQLDILFLDFDHDSLGITLETGLKETGFCTLVKEHKGQHIDKPLMNKLIAGGVYQIGIIVPEGATSMVRERAKQMVDKVLYPDSSFRNMYSDQVSIVVYFDPVIKNSFKQTIRSALNNFVSGVEGMIMFQTFAEQMEPYLPEDSDLNFDHQKSIHIEEIYAGSEDRLRVPNSVQHNVPAWTIFAMFFIIIPLTGNIIKERDSGTYLRLRMMPGSEMNILGSKIFVYLAVCFIQFILMMSVGIFVLPLLGLPALETGPHKMALLILGLSTALAATGYGVMLGNLARTHEQAASFGSVSVIILAAIGGIFVPIFIMPELMQSISIISPLNWSLEGFQDILLRGYDLAEVLPHILLLLGFFVITLLIAFLSKRS